jgi:cupin superfamily protein
MGTRTPTFAELVGDEDAFFTNYYSQRTLYRPGALAGDPREILSIADMDDIVHQEGLRSSLFRMLGQGTGVAGPTLTRRLRLRREGRLIDDALAPAKVYAHFRAGKTLIHAGLNHHRPNLRRLCALLTEKFAAPSEAVAFLTPAGKQAGGAHSDPTDVYVIQLEGTKHWRIWPTPPVRRMGEDLSHDQASLGEPLFDISLRPGDVLYLPYGTPHEAAAEEQVSLHVTVVALARSWAQLVLPIVEEILTGHDEFGTPPYAGGDRTALEATLREKVSALVDHVTNADLAGALDRVVAAGQGYEGVVEGHFFQEMADVDGIADGTLVCGVPDSSTFHGGSDGTALVTVRGNKLRMSEATAMALAAAHTAPPFRAGDFLTGDDATDSLTSVKQLIRLGALRVAAPSD